jgi:hypothetical protein
LTLLWWVHDVSAPTTGRQQKQTKKDGQTRPHPTSHETVVPPGASRVPKQCHLTDDTRWNYLRREIRSSRHQAIVSIAVHQNPSATTIPSRRESYRTKGRHGRTKLEKDAAAIGWSNRVLWRSSSIVVVLCRWATHCPSPHHHHPTPSMIRQTPNKARSTGPTPDPPVPKLHLRIERGGGPKWEERVGWRGESSILRWEVSTRERPKRKKIDGVSGRVFLFL